MQNTMNELDQLDSRDCFTSSHHITDKPTLNPVQLETISPKCPKKCIRPSRIKWTSRCSFMAPYHAPSLEIVQTHLRAKGGRLNLSTKCCFMVVKVHDSWFVHSKHLQTAKAQSKSTRRSTHGSTDRNQLGCTTTDPII